MKFGSQVGSEAELLDQRMGRLGAELIVKAALCAAMMAVVAGMVAAVAGF